MAIESAEGPFIINLAPTGAAPLSLLPPQVPLTPAAIIADVTRCVAAGAAMAHVHARDGQGEPAWQPEIHAEIIAGIRHNCPAVVIVASTTGRGGLSWEQRCAVLDLQGSAKPDMASLTLGSVTFSRGVAVNSLETMVRLAERMQSVGIKAELEVFDQGMVNMAHYLIRRGLLTPPYYFNLLLGNITTAQARPDHLAALVNALPEPAVWCVSGLGRTRRAGHALGLTWGHGVRVGLEDDLWLDDARQRPATNRDLVAGVVEQGAALGRTPATPAQVRSWLRLPAGRGA
ncbi:MAG: 3-keto-5-aminohexanoate cleavage protein [Magnetococcales bacterium]|nr:3-keto-5-aminohexanoate cleavage protein [Magnetococcales bacterium]